MEFGGGIDKINKENKEVEKIESEDLLSQAKELLLRVEGDSEKPEQVEYQPKEIEEVNSYENYLSRKEKAEQDKSTFINAVQEFEAIESANTKESFIKDDYLLAKELGIVEKKELENIKKVEENIDKFNKAKNIAEGIVAKGIVGKTQKGKETYQKALKLLNNAKKGLKTEEEKLERLNNSIDERIEEEVKRYTNELNEAKKYLDQRCQNLENQLEKLTQIKNNPEEIKEILEGFLYDYSRELKMEKDNTDEGRSIDKLTNYYLLLWGDLAVALEKTDEEMLKTILNGMDTESKEKIENIKERIRNLEEQKKKKEKERKTYLEAEINKGKDNKGSINDINGQIKSGRIEMNKLIGKALLDKILESSPSKAKELIKRIREVLSETIKTADDYLVDKLRKDYGRYLKGSGGEISLVKSFGEALSDYYSDQKSDFSSIVRDWERLKKEGKIQEELNQEDELNDKAEKTTSEKIDEYFDRIKRYQKQIELVLVENKILEEIFKGQGAFIEFRKIIGMEGVKLLNEKKKGINGNKLIREIWDTNRKRIGVVRFIERKNTKGEPTYEIIEAEGNNLLKGEEGKTYTKNSLPNYFKKALGIEIRSEKSKKRNSKRKKI